MRTTATVLYEDAMLGKTYPLHDLVLRMVEDQINGETWRLQKAVDPNPKKGVDRLLADIPDTALIAGDGMLFVLVDRDKIVKHVNQTGGKLEKNASDSHIVAALRARSDAPEKLSVFFLLPNMEGLIEAIATCGPGRWPEDVAKARRKKRLARDHLLSQAARQVEGELRTCIREHQPGLGALADALAVFLRDRSGFTL